MIRPLVYVTEAEARAYTKEYELPIIGCCCPACGDVSLQRQRIKRLLMDLEVEHPGVKQSMLKALSNVAPRHLLDTRLNPPAELRATVSIDEAIAAVPNAMIDEICLVGSKDKVRDDLEAWRDSRVTTMIVGGPLDTLRTMAELVLG
mgnify:CR=1 FL=1